MTYDVQAPGTPHRPGRRRRTGVAYACYLWIAAFLAIGEALDLLFGAPRTSDELSRWQGIGMLVILPLTLSALAAAIVGVKASLELWRDWLPEYGLLVLPLLLSVFLLAFAASEADMLGRRWLQFAAAGYVLAGFGFPLRWFLSARHRHARRA